MKRSRWILLIIVVFYITQCTSVEKEIKTESDKHMEWIDSVLSADTLGIKE